MKLDCKKCKSDSYILFLVSITIFFLFRNLPIESPTKCCYSQKCLERENDDKNKVSNRQYGSHLIPNLPVVNAKTQGIDEDCSQYQVFEHVSLHQFKACQSETVGRNNWDDLWVESDEESLDLNPFLLLLSKVVTPCPLFDFFIELFNDD